MRGRTPGGALGTDILTRGASESISRYRRFFRIRISRAAGPIRRVHSLSCSWVIRYPRCCHHGRDFHATPSAFRLVPKGLEGVEEIRIGILRDFSITEWMDEEIERRLGKASGTSAGNLEKSDS